MGLFGGIASAVGGIASTILGNNSAKHEAEINRDWQADMSNTSVKRRIADLKAAGLNPLLAVQSAQGGASTPTGSQADIKHFNPDSILALSNARLVNAQAKAQEQDNNLYEFKKDQMILRNERERQGILNDIGMRELNSAKTLEAKANTYLKRCQAAGVNMTLEKAKREVQMLDIELGILKNPEDSEYAGAVAKFYGDNTKSPTQSVGFLGSLLYDQTEKAISNFFGNLEKKRKNKTKYVPVKYYGGNR